MDDGQLARAAAAFPNATRYNDYRRMIERQDIDAVLVSTPDHMHAAVSLAAMQTGKHVYCEKPLTHDVAEARQMAEWAVRSRVATQMGTQGHSNDGTRRVVELVRAGVIGPVSEFHCWTDRPIWPQGIGRPTDMPPVPAGVHWDLWLGNAPMRPYHSAYHPFKWRGFWDFGTGAVGDMACHVMDTAFWALDLDAPDTVEAEGSPRNDETAPSWMAARFTFPARGNRGPVRGVWYEAKRLPPAELFEGETVPGNGTLLIGERGKLFLPDAYGSSFVLLPRSKFQGFQPPAPSIPNSIGHHAEWIAAAKGGASAGSHFEYAARLTETVLLGNVAFRCGQKLQWDTRAMKATNCPQADALIARKYRPGWEI